MAQEPTIRGMAAHEKGVTFKPWEYKAHPLGPNEVEVKITHCGVCHSDIHTVNGDWGERKYPLIVGHEIVGTVSRVGADVKNVALGDRVGVGAQCGSCHTCRVCQRHREQYCDKIVFTYQSTLADGFVTQGGYASHYRCDSYFAVKIPASLDSARAAPLLCAGATVWKPIVDAKLSKGMKCGVIGIGGLGHMAIQFLAKMGHEVWALTTSPNKLDDVTKILGGKGIVLYQDKAARQAHVGTFDFILNTASADLPWADLLGLLVAEGQFSSVGAPPASISIPSFLLNTRGYFIHGSHIGSPEELDQMLAFCATHNVQCIVETLPLSQATEAVARTVANKMRYRMVLEIPEAL